MKTFRCRDEIQGCYEKFGILSETRKNQGQTKWGASQTKKGWKSEGSGPSAN